MRRIQSPYFLFIVLAFLIWIFCFREFLSGERSFASDAIAYYEHFNYFIINLSRGVYPLWEPSRNSGVPVEFFLRRIGSYNPFYIVLVVSYLVGIPLLKAYLIFLASYFFLGMIGFYLLAKRIFQDSRLAFVAYLILMFSSLGTRLFDSYILFTVIPMIWFFYFLIDFFGHPQKKNFLGMLLALMILITTYIPFYFITIFMTFFICFIAFYFKECRTLLSEKLKFMNSNRWFALFCLTVFILALVPGIRFYDETKRAEIVLPQRQIKSTIDEALGVGVETVTKWGIEEDLAFAGHFANLRDFQFALIYVPIFALIIFGLNSVTNATRKFMFLLVWGCLIMLVSSPEGTPIYRFLYDHVFYFKYFRNLHFFLWMILLPLFVLTLVEQFGVLLAFKPKTVLRKYITLILLALVHAFYLWFLYVRGQAILSSYLAVILSAVFFWLYFSGWLREKLGLFLLFMTALTVIQPLDVYHYLTQNSPRLTSPYRYGRYFEFTNFNFIKLTFSNEDERRDFFSRHKSQPIQDSMAVLEKKEPQVYMDVKAVSLLRDNLKTIIFENYIWKSLLVYDFTQWMDQSNYDLKAVATSLARNQNLAYISPPEFLTNDYDPGTVKKPEGIENSMPQTIQGDNYYSDIITPRSKDVRVLGFDINYIKLKTNFNTKKFLVYNDAFYKEWEAFVDNQWVDLWRANIGFKGLWIPAGEHVVYMRFGSRALYILQFILLGAFQIVFWLLLFLYYNDFRSQYRPSE